MTEETNAVLREMILRGTSVLNGGIKKYYLVSNAFFFFFKKEECISLVKTYIANIEMLHGDALRSESKAFEVSHYPFMNQDITPLSDPYFTPHFYLFFPNTNSRGRSSSSVRI